MRDKQQGWEIPKSVWYEFGKDSKGSDRGLSQGRLEFENKESKNQIVNIKRGEVNTTLSTLTLIAIALDIPVKELFDFE
jgi:hypothetical protein